MLRIYNNGGRLRYPADEPNRSKYDEYDHRIEDWWDNGLAFHYDKTRNRLICYFSGSVSSGQSLVPNQFFAIYDGDGNESDPLAEFRNKIESAFDSQGWVTSDSSMGPATIYNNLTTEQSIDLAISHEEIEELLSSKQTTSKKTPAPIQLGAPDFDSSIQVCRQLIDNDDFQDIRVTISAGGAGEDVPIPETDIVIIPDATDEPGAPVSDTKRRRENQQLRSLIQETQKRYESFINEGEGSVDALIERFESRSRGTNKFDYQLYTQSRRKSKENRNTRNLGIIGILIGIALMSGLVYVLPVPTTFLKEDWLFFLCLFFVIIIRLYDLWVSFSTDTNHSTDGTHLHDPKQRQKADQLLEKIQDILDHPATDKDRIEHLQNEILHSSRLKIAHSHNPESKSGDSFAATVKKGISSPSPTQQGFYGVIASVSVLTVIIVMSGVPSSLRIRGSRVSLWTLLLWVPALLSIGAWVTRMASWSDIKARIVKLKTLRSMIRPLLASVYLLSGTLFVAQSGIYAWQQGDGLTYQLISIVAIETIGRISELDAWGAINVLFLIVAGILITVFAFATWKLELPERSAPRALVLSTPGALFCSTLVGFIHITVQMNTVVDLLAMIVPIVVFGLTLSGLVIFGSRKIIDQIVTYISYSYIVLIVGVLIESRLTYEISDLNLGIPPLFIEFTSGGVHPLMNDSLYPFINNPVLDVVPQLSLTLIFLYPLWTAVSDVSQTEVLVIGPDTQTGEDYIDRLQKNMLATYKTTSDKSDSLITGFTTDSTPALRVWTPGGELESNIYPLDTGVIERICEDGLKRKCFPDNLPNERTRLQQIKQTFSSRPGIKTILEQKREIAVSLTEADVIVLLFPDRGDTQKTKQGGGREAESQQGYFDSYLRLLEALDECESGNSSRTILGTITGRNDEDKQEPEDLPQTITERVFEECDQDKAEFLEKMDNDGSLLDGADGVKDEITDQ